MRIAENDSGSLGFSKKLKMSFMSSPRLARMSDPRGPSYSVGELTLPRAAVRLQFLAHRFDELDVEAERLELLDENVEALR